MLTVITSTLAILISMLSAMILAMTGAFTLSAVMLLAAFVFLVIVVKEIAHFDL